MRELEVLGNGHLKLNRSECKEFFTQELAEVVRWQLKRLIEEALLVERDRYLNLGVYEHAPLTRLDFRNGFYFRDLVTKLGVLCRLRVPRTRKGFRSQFLPRYQRPTPRLCRDRASARRSSLRQPVGRTEFIPSRSGARRF
jgi:transposase-like protein